MKLLRATAARGNRLTPHGKSAAVVGAIAPVMRRFSLKFCKHILLRQAKPLTFGVAESSIDLTISSCKGWLDRPTSSVGLFSDKGTKGKAKCKSCL